MTSLRDRHANSGSRLEHVTIDLAREDERRFSRRPFHPFQTGSPQRRNLGGFGYISRGAESSDRRRALLLLGVSLSSSVNRDTFAGRAGKIQKTPPGAAPIIVAFRPTPRPNRAHADNCSTSSPLTGRDGGADERRQSSHSTAGRTSIIRRTIAESADSCRFHNTPASRLPASQRTTSRSRWTRAREDEDARNGTRRAAIARSERASFECASRSPGLSGSALGTESGEREAPSDFRGIHRHPYRRGGRYPCLLLSRQPACCVSPAAPTPPPSPRSADAARLSSPRLHRPSPLP